MQELREQELAALKLQTVQRGRQARQQVQQLKAQQWRAAQMIQAARLGQQGRRDAAKLQAVRQQKRTAAAKRRIEIERLTVENDRLRQEQLAAQALYTKSATTLTLSSSSVSSSAAIATTAAAQGNSSGRAENFPLRQLPPSSMQSFGGDVNAETEEMLTVGVSGSDSDATQPVSPPLLWRAQAQVMEAPTASLPRVVSDAPATVKTAWDVPAASSAAIFSGHETAVPELMMNFAIFGGASHVLDLAASAPDSTATTLVDALLSRFVGKLTRLGSSHPGTILACKELVAACSSAAMKQLQERNFGTALQLLQKAERASVQYQHLRVEIFNCVACCLQQQGKHMQALQYLHKARKLSTKWDTEAIGADVRATTHLNTSAVLSRLGKHLDGLREAKNALRWAKKAQAKAVSHMLCQSDKSGNARRAQLDAASLLAIALHNAAVQHEHLQQWTHAVAAYHAAVHCAKHHLGRKAAITKALVRSQRQAAAKALSCRSTLGPRGSTKRR